VRRENDRRPVFDASAVLALMQGEKGSDKLGKLQHTALVNAVNAAEVVGKLVSRGMPEGEARAAYDALHLETFSFEPQDAMVSARYVGRNIALGDRCFLASAHRHGLGWTADRALEALVGQEGPALHFFR
jgi:PIN domain nuclease of toxin-antitoxin system